MKLFITKYIGFCGGVANAVSLALKQEGKRIFTLGKLVHNENVLGKLKSKDIEQVDDVSKLSAGDTVIIRAHGVAKEIFQYCIDNNITVIDATCKSVKNIQLKAQKYYNEGYQIVLIGDRNHAEIIGINGWCNNSAIIINTDDEAVDLTNYQKILIMFQTTFNITESAKIIQNIITDNSKTVEIFDTICYTTICKQKEAELLSKQCDCCLIIGSNTSSNSKQLVSVCKVNCPNTFLVCNPQDLSSYNFSLYNNIALICSASTPTELFEEVTNSMVAIANDNKETSEEVVETTVKVNEFTKAIDKMHHNFKPYRKGMKVKGTVSHVDNEGISISIGTKKDGMIPNEEICLNGDIEQFKSTLRVGDSLEAIIISTDKSLVLSHKAIQVLYKDDALIDGIKEGNEFTTTPSKAVKGGLLSKLGSYTVFIPASHIKNGFVSNLEQYVGKKMRVIALQDGVDDSKKKIVASQKELLNKEKKEKEENFWNNIEINEVVDGKVLRFAPFGAFVSVRGFDCLAHLSDLSWNNIQSPGEVLEINKTYEFVVIKLDREANRVSLGYKQLQLQPWQLAAEQFPVGSIVKGKVVRILSFGAFVELASGIDGLLHVSNMSWEWLDDISKAVKVGDEIEVVVIDADIENKRITLSRKPLLQQPEIAKPSKASQEPKE